MIVTEERLQTIHLQLIEHRNTPPPRAVLFAVAVLIGQDNTSALMCEAQSDVSNTRWHVVGLLDSGCLFDLTAVGALRDPSGALKDGELTVYVEPSNFRSLSDVAFLRLTETIGLDTQATNNSWDVSTRWEICWRDGSPSLALPTRRTDPRSGERAATEIIIDKIRQVLAARR
jgi:hypothetical protein